MTPDLCLSAVRAFVALFDGESAEDDENILERILDQLAVAQALVETAFDDRDWPDPPHVDYPIRRARVSQRFPRLGYYNIASDICGQPGEGDVNVGDAADDLADILGDLSEVLWRWENTSREDAIWHLQLTYRYHWGGHLRSLQLLLYERMRGGGAA